MAQLFTKLVRREVAKSIFEAKSYNSTDESEKYRIVGRPNTWSHGVMEKTYLKKALAQMNRELDLEPDSDSDEFFEDGDYKSDWSSDPTDSSMEEEETHIENSPGLRPKKVGTQ